MLGGILAGLGAGALWGLVFIAPQLAPGLSAVDLVAGRYLFYGLTSLLVMAVQMRSRPLPTWRQAGAAAGLSVLGFSGYYLLLVLAIRDAGPALPTLMVGTIPLWVMLLGKPEHLQWRQLLPGLLLTALGLVLMVEVPHAADGQDGGAQAWTYWRGVAYAVAAMLSWTFFAVLNSAWLKTHRDISTTDWANWMGVAAGVAALVLWAAVGSEPKVLLAQADIAQAAMVCIAIGVGSGWLATVLWNRASRRLSASLCGQLIVSETLFGLAFAFAVLGQRFTLAQIVASVLFVLGILASIRAHR
ncbi:DMT family transporter [Rhodoferax saidenbachensis]|uniref:EamA family transporter n=1 Tax=Rhodoferax saidenbachensis TaxID=1484693 RepID=A0A1P8K8K5_9BURK|nr:DMT family transporter [Rhodoferax saidenbachensis]APW42324.1 EamA family transporter [Rhodoferax saidenbachensis]